MVECGADGGNAFVLCGALSVAKLSPVKGGCGIDCSLFFVVCSLPVDPGFPVISSGQN